MNAALEAVLAQTRKPVELPQVLEVNNYSEAKGLAKSIGALIMMRCLIISNTAFSQDPTNKYGHLKGVFTKTIESSKQTLQDWANQNPSQLDRMLAELGITSEQEGK